MTSPARHLPLLIAIPYVAFVLGYLQSSAPHLVDQDSLYHARFAQMMPTQGFSRSFPWAQESVWKDRFADKEILFHAWLAPFCRESHTTGGAKVAAWILALAIVYAFGIILTANGIRWPWLWTALIPALGNHFLFRLQEVRPHLLSILLLLLGLHALLQSRWRLLAILGFIYSWSYAAPHLLVVFAAIHAVALKAAGERWEWRGLAASAGGVLAGLVINPYVPNDLSQWWIINVRIMIEAWSSGGPVRLGEEFQPVSTRSLLLSSTLVGISFIGAFLMAAHAPASISRRSKILLAWAVGGFAMYCMSAKFIEYFAPLALLAVASVASERWEKSMPSFATMAVAGVAAVVLTVMSVRDARGELMRLPTPDLAGAAAWTKKNVPAGETIVHLEWGDFNQLYYYDPTHYYLVGLDPMFMYVRHPKGLQLLEDLRSGRKALDVEELYHAFNARYLVVRTRLRVVPEQVGLRPVYEDRGGAVYALIP